MNFILSHTFAQKKQYRNFYQSLYSLVNYNNMQ